uniref:MFS domain-containing protein n=1 Tax=Rhabditophanes sp. KR3021 TaxID=114890 RepID=A0AC35UDR2_9BILA
MANGVYSAVPFLFQVVLKMGWSFFVSKLVKENKITLNTSAKLSQFISGITTAIFFFLIPLTLDCTKPYITVLLLAIGTSGFDLLSCGFLVSLLSIAPNHTGLLTSLHTMNGIMARIGAPYLFSLFRTTGTPEDWKNILWLIGGLWLFVSIIFTIFGSVEVQPWNNTSKPNNVNDFKKKGEETLFIEGVNEIVVIT